MAKAGRRIKLSKNMVPFVSRVVRTGPAQVQFAEKIGKKVGSCVGDATRGKSHFLHEKIAILKACMRSAGVKKGMTIGTIDPNSYYNRLRAGKVGGGQAT